MATVSDRFRTSAFCLLPSAFFCLCLIPLLHSLPRAQTPAGRVAQTDGVTRVLADLQTAILGQSEQAFLELTSGDLPDPDRAVFMQVRDGQGAVAATLRERDRRIDGTGVVVLADLLVSHGLRGRVGTWELTLKPSARQ